jgi:hypothetical protein
MTSGIPVSALASVTGGNMSSRARSASKSYRWQGPIVRTIRDFLARRERDRFKHTWQADSGGKRGLGYIHPSEISRCPRSVYYCCIEEEPIGRFDPLDDLALFDTGHALHGWSQSCVTLEVEHVMGAPGFFVDEIPIRWGKNPWRPDLPLVGGHADGRLIWTPKLEELFGYKYPLVLEIKTCNLNTFSKPPVSGSPGGRNSPPDYYKWQALLYMLATGIFQVHFLFICKNNSQMSEITYFWDDVEWAKCAMRINLITDCVMRREPPPPETNPRNCKTCSYLHMCPEGRAAVM